MIKKYEQPKMEVEKFSIKNEVLTASTPDIDGGDGQGGNDTDGGDF